MAFNPRTDVVLEVASAADPSRVSLAAQRLNALAGPNAPAGDFAADLDQAAAPRSATSAPLANGVDARSRLQETQGGPDKTRQARTQFEAMMLNSFVSELLPKDTGEVFGQGTAGDMWRSMLAEQVSMQIAKSGKLGIARRLFATHEVAPQSGHIAETARAAGASAAQMSANILSAPTAAKAENGAVLFGGRRA